VRKNFLKFKSLKSFPEKIFIERSKSISTYRDIKNKDDVYRILKNNNFHFVKPENFGIKDQIKMFYSAKKIVGLHGAGFANICFCNPKTEIIEFKTTTTGMNSGNIALKNDLDYKGIICEASGKYGGQQGQLIVPLEELKNKI
jgi:capsular polysaccharide biosynthesis protein